MLRWGYLPTVDMARLTRRRGDFAALAERLDRIVAEQRQRVEAAGVESHGRPRP